MPSFIEILKTIFLGIVEGITEWLPISSTGHMILVDEFIKLNVTDEFKEFFLVVIQLGAILAVVILFWSKIWPFHLQKTKVRPFFKPNSGALPEFCNKYVYMHKIILWLKILVASIPAAIIGFMFDDQIDSMLTGELRAYVVAAALIFYGILFIIIESLNKKTTITDTGRINYKTALLVGIMQCLALVPGTSRSGTTILGGMLLGMSRVAAAEFSFFLSIPAMVGGSGVKLLKYIAGGNSFTSSQLVVLLLGMVTAFVVSYIVIKFLMEYIKKRDFKVFGWYRIVLGVIIFAYFLLIAN